MRRSSKVIIAGTSGEINEDDAIHNEYKVNVTGHENEQYTIGIQALNYGTKDWIEASGIAYKIYDKCKNGSAFSTNALGTVNGLADWADVDGANPSNTVTFTYTFPNKSCLVIHEYNVVEMRKGHTPIHFGDVLRVIFDIEVVPR